MELQVRTAESRDLPEIKALMDQYLSRDYCSMEELEDILAGERRLLVADAAELHFLLGLFALQFPQTYPAVLFVLPNIVQIAPGAFDQLHSHSSSMIPKFASFPTFVSNPGI